MIRALLRNNMTVLDIPTFTLPRSLNHAQIPAIGFGSGTAWRILKHKRSVEAAADSQEPEIIEELVESTKNAILAGFRHIDTAEAYFTHREVGLGIKNSGVARSEIFLTDKYSPSTYKKLKSSGPYESLTTALKELDTGYVDLYLIHGPDIDKEEIGISLEEAWLEVEKLHKDGLAKNIGVSNFSIEYLDRIIKAGTIKPQVNQIEFNAYLQNQSPGIVKFAKDNDILIEAYSPLAPLFRARPGPLDELLPSLVEKYGKSESQILLRWVYQNGILPLTTSSKVERLQDALEIFTFELEQEDFNKITELGKKKLFRAFAVKLYGKYDDELLKGKD